MSVCLSVCLSVSVAEFQLFVWKRRESERNVIFLVRLTVFVFKNKFGRDGYRRSQMPTHS